MNAFFQTMVIMLGAITTSHLQNGFFMNWFGKQQGKVTSIISW